MFQLDGLIERNLKKNKELSAFVNTYDSLYSKPLTERIYNDVVSYLKRQYLRGFAIGASSTLTFKFISDEAQKNQNQSLDLIAILGLGFFSCYTLVNVIRLIELETNEEELLKQSRECAQKVIKEKLGIKK